MKITQLIFKMLISLVLGLVFSFAFNIFLFNLPARPLVDRLLLIGVAALAFGYLVFAVLEQPDKLKPAWTAIHEKSVRWKSTALVSFLREHAPGLILALFFVCVYTYLGLRLNHPGIDTTDNFLDADNFTWMRRIAWENGYQYEMRGPHPFAYLIFRPLGWIFNLFLQNPFLSALLLNTLTGGLCVFLAWIFVKDRFQNKIYALLIAALMGSTTSHLWFGSVIESYIFSAAALMSFFVLLQSKKDATCGLILAGLVTFGITLTNVLQTFIGFLVTRPKIKGLIRYAGIVISLGLILSLIQSAWYPSSKLFFLASNALAERDFSISIFQEPSWRAMGRIVLLIRTILVYTVIAPRPFVFGEEVGGAFPRFNFFLIAPGEYAFSSYDGLGNLLVFLWAGLLLAAGIFFLRNTIRKRNPDMALAFVLCIAFNFALHLSYGYEPFLYSPDWAYALVFFVALALGGFAQARWFHVGLLVFFVLLAYNQWQFFKFVFDTIAPFLG
ncbi:MAG: hypothetical protein A2W33_00650 [Chloroflexi bacterium RBG_16_52_11]|nr:MAG: hypothetical protein A2W33_00650 [Chloroflexi bacterium RBG_16_52_11]